MSNINFKFRDGRQVNAIKSIRFQNKCPNCQWKYTFMIKLELIKKWQAGIHYE